MSSSPRPVLIIAASDSSGGAGLTRDVETLRDFATPLRCALTAVTAQSNAQLQRVHALPIELLRSQLDAAMADGPVGAIKIGMLATAAAVQLLAQWLPRRERVPIVLDPVLLSSSGGELLEPAAIPLLKALLIPRVTLLTPNLPEAAALLGCAVARDAGECREQLRRLQQLGSSGVLLKGGHTEVALEASPDAGLVTDWLAMEAADPLPISTARIGAQRRGTGCSASSAIAAQLAAGVPLAPACVRAQSYVAALLRS